MPPTIVWIQRGSTGCSTYDAEIASEQNRFRWVEYSLSSTLMIVTIRLVFGIGDIAGLIGIIGILPWIGLLVYLFGLNLYLQYRKVGKWADDVYGEKVYLWLSLIAKSALAWQLYGNALSASDAFLVTDPENSMVGSRETSPVPRSRVVILTCRPIEVPSSWGRYGG